MNQPPTFPPGTRSYLETVTDREEVWLQEGTEEKRIKWLRCNIVGAIERCEDGFIAQVGVQRCVQELRTGLLNKLRSLFPSAVPEDSLYIPTVSGILGEETARMPDWSREKKHLVWGNVTLENHPEFEQITRLGEFSLVTVRTREEKGRINSEPQESVPNCENRISMSNLTPLQGKEEPMDILKLQQRILQALSPHCTLKRAHEVSNPEKILICIPQDHGDLATMEKLLARKEKDAIRRWFVHQNELVAIQRVIDTTEERDHCHFFLEALAEKYEFYENKMHPDMGYVIRNNESVYDECAYDADRAAELISAVLAEKQNAYDVLISLMGMHRYVNLMAINQAVARERFIGIIHPERYSMLAQSQFARQSGNIEEFKRLRMEDAMKLNKYVAMKINRYLSQGDCGILLLGAAHFYDEREYAAKDGQYADYNPAWASFQIDGYLHRTNGIGNTNIFVMKPNSLE